LNRGDREQENQQRTDEHATLHDIQVIQRRRFRLRQRDSIVSARRQAG
jgi:hypothetical protein